MGILDDVKGFFTWARVIIGIVGATATASVVSWGVANYVADKSYRGLEQSITTLQESLARSTQNLQASVDGLTASVRAVDDRLIGEVRRFNDGQELFAEKVADKIEKLVYADGSKSEAIRAIQSGLERIERSLDQVKLSMKINYDGSSGVAKFLNVNGYGEYLKNNEWPIGKGYLPGHTFDPPSKP